MKKRRKRFEQQVAIVTGAAIGIGFEIARSLATEGANIILNDIDEAQTNIAIKKIESETENVCIGCVGDVSDLKTIDRLVDKAMQHFGRLDIAVANAGITLFGDFFNFKEADFQRVMDVNLKASFFLVQRSAQQMRQQNQGGNILLMSSIVGQRAYPQLTAYAMTKAALAMMARNLVLELAPHHIRINAIAPGATLTERTALEAPNYAAVWEALNPNSKVALPEDIANTALFLLSSESTHINGQTITIDGGWTAVGRHPNSGV